MNDIRIRHLGDPVLRTMAGRVATVDESLRALHRRMVEIMHEEGGIGLAAPQVGQSLRLFVLDVPGYPSGVALINPVVSAQGATRERAAEGCLSIPGIQVGVERPARVHVQATRLVGPEAPPEEVSFEATGLLARAIQHEQDHLDGVLILDRTTQAERERALARWDELPPDLLD